MALSQRACKADISFALGSGQIMCSLQPLSFVVAGARCKRYDDALTMSPMREGHQRHQNGNNMISDAQRDAYQRDGFIVVPDLLGAAELSELREIIAELVAGAAAVDTHTAVYDLEPGHTRAE